MPIGTPTTLLGFPLRLTRMLVHAALLLLFVAPAAWGEEAETDGFAVQIPAGYQKIAKAELAGGRFKFGMAGGLFQGEPEIHAYLKGTAAEPLAAVVAMYVPIPGDAARASGAVGGIPEAQLESLREQGFRVEQTKIQGRYDALSLHARMEDIPAANGHAGDFRALVVVCDDYAIFLSQVTFQPELMGQAEFEWQRMVASLDIGARTNWTLILLIVLGGGAVLLFFGRVLTKKPPQLTFTPSDPRDFIPTVRAAPGLTPSGLEPALAPQAAPDAGRDFTFAQTRVDPAPWTREGNELPPASPVGGATLPGPTPIAAEAAPKPKSEPAAPPAPAPGLRSTLPASGRWSDQFKDA